MDGIQDQVLLLTSYGVAAIAVYAVLDLGLRIGSLQGARALFWLLAGSLAIGTGIWCAHFVGMNALQPFAAGSFDPRWTAVSWMSASVIALPALFALSRKRLQVAEFWFTALIMGAGVTSVDFASLAALRLPAADAAGISPSFAAGVLAFAAACGAQFVLVRVRHLRGDTLRRAKIGIALVLGAALCSTDFTMLAVAHLHNVTLPAGAITVDRWIAVPLAIICTGVIVMVLLLSLVDVHAAAESRDQARKRAAADSMRRLTYFDPLTGLPNRAQFNEALLRQLIAVNGHQPPPFEIIHLKLRAHAAVVDDLGHDRLNRVFRLVAQRLQAAAPAGSLLARLSHDSIGILVRDPSAKLRPGAAANVPAAFGPDVVADLLARAVVDCGEPITLGWAVGACRYPDHGNSVRALVRAANKTVREVPGASLAHEVPDSGFSLA